jgi:hypothetical protein
LKSSRGSQDGRARHELRRGILEKTARRFNLCARIIRTSKVDRLG